MPQAFQLLSDFQGDHLSVSMFGVTGDGVTNDAPAIQSAINATASGQTLLLPRRQYLLKGTGTELLLASKPIRLIFEPGATLLIDPSVGASTDVLRLLPPTGGGTDYCIENMVIRPVSGNPARHGINIDCTTDVLYKSMFDRMNIQNLGGCGFYVNNPNLLFTGGFFTSTIRESYFGGLKGAAAVYLNSAGDSIHIKHCTFFGDQLGILADLISGAHGLLILDCNSSALKGFLKILSGDSATIYGGDLEVTGAASAGTAEPAILHIAGRVGAPVLNFLIDCRYLGVSTIPRAIKVDYAQNTDIRSVECAVGYGPGTTGSNEMIHITANATNTIIGQHVSFTGGAPPSRNYLDLSTSTIYPPVVNPQANAPLLRDSSGAGQLASLVTNQGTFGYFQNAAFKSEEFDAVAWVKGGSTISITGTGPDGAASARKLIEDTSTGTHSVYQDQGVASDGETWWFAIYAKAAERTQVRLQLQNSTSSKGAQATFDLSNNGAVISSSAFGGPTLLSYSAVALANSWYRLIISAKTATFDDVLYATELVNAGNSSYTGDGSSGLYLFGASVSKNYLSPYVRTSAGLPSVAASWGLLSNALDPAAANRLVGPTAIPGPLTILHPTGATAITLQDGAVQAGTPLITVQDASAAFMCLLSAAGEWNFANGKHLYGRDTAGTTIPILTWETDNTVKIGWQTAPTSNGHLLLFANGAEGARVTPAWVFQAKNGVCPDNQATTALRAGIGSPESVVTAAIGSLYMRIDGAAGAALYVKESGTGNTGWIAYSAGGASALLKANNLSDLASVSTARTNLGVDASLSVAGWTVTLAKITTTGANGSLTVDAHGRITAYTAPT